jgi:hypothetical protein
MHAHHINWWMVAFIVSAVATQIRDYVPKPGSAPGFISNPWYPLIYHGILDLLSMSFLKTFRGLAGNGNTPAALPGVPADFAKDPNDPNPQK